MFINQGNIDWGHIDRDISKLHIIHFTPSTLNECLNEIATIVSDCGTGFALDLEFCMNLTNFGSNDIIGVVAPYPFTCQRSFRSNVSGSIQWHVIPMKLLWWAVHISAVVHTVWTSWSVSVSASFIFWDPLSMRCINVFLHMGVLPPLIPAIISRNEAFSTKEKGCTSAIMNSRTKEFTFLWVIAESCLSERRWGTWA